MPIRSSAFSKFPVESSRRKFLKGTTSHIDDKYGIDVDDVYQIEDILIPEHKEKYQVVISKEKSLPDNEIHPGYFRLNKL
jgi:hypothetical protein